MPEYEKEIKQLAKEFESCQKILLALGDENRQHLILEMMKIEECDGVRVGTITEKTNLSRSAVSHHIQILKEAGILRMRREGTKNYYYFDADTEAMNRLIHMLEHAKCFMKQFLRYRRKLTRAIGKAACIFSLLQMSRKPLALLWRIMESSAV